MFPCQLKGKNTLHYIDGVGQKTLNTPVSYIFALNGPLFYYFILEQDIIKYKYQKCFINQPNSEKVKYAHVLREAIYSG